MILADTDVLIDYLRGVEPMSTHLDSLLESGILATTAVTTFELLSGASKGRRGDATERLAKLLEALPLDRTAAEVAAAVRRDLDSVGTPIGMADSLIAGIALANNAPLLTRNRRHFDRVLNLNLHEFS